jgi:glycosyltransferase involved in cell wall biosynthesis
MKEDLLLVFAYHFPPDSAIGAARPFRFCKYLDRLGYDSYTITAADVRSRPDLKAEYVPDPFIARPREGFGWQVERFIRKFLLPGVTGTQWAVLAYRAARKFVAQDPNRRVTIFSTFPPLGTHLAAFLLARKTGYPWIADFRDPLADNPGSGDLNDFQHKIYRRLERTFVNRAARVIANTDAAETRLKSMYPARAGNVHLIWNGFDPEQRLEALPLLENSCRVFSHVGELYEGRSITPLLESIKRLLDAGRLEQNKIKIRLVGAARTSSLPDPAFLEAATTEGWLDLIPHHVPQAEAHCIMQSSDGLLLVQPHSTLQVPGKLYEYLQIGRPILAFVPPHSSIERILQKSGIPYACAYSTGDGSALDDAVLRFFMLESATVTPNEWFETEFNAQHHAEKLARLIDELHKPPDR